MLVQILHIPINKINEERELCYCQSGDETFNFSNKKHENSNPLALPAVNWRVGVIITGKFSVSCTCKNVHRVNTFLSQLI